MEPVNSSSVTGWSSGSIHTSLHTSVRRVAVRSHISLCLIDGKPPLVHDKACSTEKEAPQAQFNGSLSGVQPGHHEKLLCVGQSRALKVAEQ